MSATQTTPENTKSAGVYGHTMNTSDARESFDEGSNSNMSATQRPSRGESDVAVVRLRVWPCEHGPTDSMIPESPRIRKWNGMNGVMQVCDLSELFHSGGIGAWQRSDDRRYMNR